MISAGLTRRHLLLGGAGLTVAVFGKANPAFCAQVSDSDDLDGLVRAAKTEGGVLTFYTSLPENIAKRVGAEFKRRYGIATSYIRLSGPGIQQRFLSEAAAGTFAADLLVSAGNNASFAGDAFKKGWVYPLDKADLPILKSGQFPAKYFKVNYATIQISPWAIGYRTDAVQGPDIPKDWSDLLNPKWKGEILLADPAASTSYLDTWAAVQAKYGNEFFEKFRAQQPRVFASGVPMTQALAAGEGKLGVVTAIAVAADLIAKGAPLGTVILDPTAGIEQAVILVAPTKVKHPNTARLFANFVMSPDGNALVNADAGNVSVYAAAATSTGYTEPDPAIGSRMEEFRKLLGL